MRVLKIATIASAFCLSFQMSGQSLISTYNFERVGEFHLSNPASYQPYRAIVGIPGIAGITTYVHNPSFDILPVITPGLDGNESIEYVLDNVTPGDRLLVDQRMELMYVGFRTGNGFWSLGSTLRTQVSFEYPVNLLNLLYYGSVAVDNQFSMTNYNTQINSYISYHLGYQHELMDGRLRIGGRFKYLSGLAHTSTPNANLQAHFNSNQWTFNSDIEARIASVEPVDSTLGTNLPDNPMMGVFSDNRGYAFDLGVSYEVIPGLEVSAAAIDIGSITWNTNATVYRSKGEYYWEGHTVNYPDEGGEFDPGEILDEIIDSLDFKETSESFTTTLPRSFMAGVRYEITPKHGFGATYQLNQIGSASYSNVGLSYIGNWSKWFSFYANYSIIDGQDDNVGVGFSANLGPIQLYLVTDDVMTATFEDARMANIRFGMNIALYRRDLKGYADAQTLPAPSVVPGQVPVEPTEETETETPSEEESDGSNNEY